MAKLLKNGLMSGKIGSLVYYVINGKQYVRNYVIPDNPNTPAQHRHRTKIKVCGKFISKFKTAILVGYQGFPTGEAFSEAMKYHMANAMEDTTPHNSVDPTFKLIPEKIVLSVGIVQAPEITTCSRNGRIIELTWNPTLGHVPNRHTDALAVIAFIEGKKAFTNFYTGTRDDGTGKVMLPFDFHEPVHLWTFYWNGQKSEERNKENVSDSIYLGSF